VPLNVTVLAPWLAPKFVPVIVTSVPTVLDAGDRLVMLGVGSTVNAAPALATPFTVTTTFPEAAPTGTGTTIDVALQLVGVAAVPLNVTVLVPWLAPKFVPVMVTGAPTAAAGGDKLTMVGVGGGGGVLLLPLPHPARPSVAPRAIQTQRTPALLATSLHLARRKLMSIGITPLVRCWCPCFRSRQTVVERSCYPDVGNLYTLRDDQRKMRGSLCQQASAHLWALRWRKSVFPQHDRHDCSGRC